MHQRHHLQWSTAGEAAAVFILGLNRSQGSGEKNTWYEYKLNVQFVSSPCIWRLVSDW